MNTTTRLPLDIKSPSVGQSFNPSVPEGVKVYVSRPTALKASSNLVMSISSPFVMSSVITSSGWLSTHVFTVPR